MSAPVRGESDAHSFGRADMLLLLMCLIWGINYTVIKQSLVDFLPLSFNALRFVIASGLTLALTYSSGRNIRVDKRDLPRMWLLGLLANTIYQSLFIFGMAHTRAGNAALILATTPLFTALIGWLRRQEHFTGLGVAGLLLAFAGMTAIIISGPKGVSIGEDHLGDFLMIASTICWALYTSLTRTYVHKYGALKTTTIMMLTGTPILLLVSFPSLSSQNWRAAGATAWAGLFFSGVLAIGFAYIIWNHGVQKIGSTRTALYSNITPIIALLVAWIGIGETPRWGQVAGAVIIFAAIYLVRRGVSHVATTPTEEERVILRPGKN